jgi:beta-glucan synthesis-associated protein KRE6
MSDAFGKVDFQHLSFPASFLIDYVRVYQDPNLINIGCNPAGMETTDYIYK